MKYELTKQLVDLHSELHFNWEWLRVAPWGYDTSKEFIDKAHYLTQLLDQVVVESNNLKKMAYKGGY